MTTSRIHKDTEYYVLDEHLKDAQKQYVACLNRKDFHKAAQLVKSAIPAIKRKLNQRIIYLKSLPRRAKPKRQGQVGDIVGPKDAATPEIFLTPHWIYDGNDWEKIDETDEGEMTREDRLAEDFFNWLDRYWIPESARKIIEIALDADEVFVVVEGTKIYGQFKKIENGWERTTPFPSEPPMVKEMVD